MYDPLGQDVAQMRFGERNEKVQTLAPNGADQPFAKCVCLRRVNRGAEDRQTHRGQHPIHSFRVNAVMVVNHVPMRLITRNDHAERCAVHSAVGCAVVFQCTMRRVPSSSTTNTYTTRNVAVTATKKSHA